MLSGVKATKADCIKGKTDAVWTDPSDTGKNAGCLKYWHSGLKEVNDRVIVYLEGDIRNTNLSYQKLSTEVLNELVNQRSQAYKAPYIFLGRPGTHGSSGNHAVRRTLDEVGLVNAAIDQLKQRYDIREFVIAGLSGGGFLTASLLNFRSDIYCAVPASAPSSPKIRYTRLGLSKDTTGRIDSYEPTHDKMSVRPHEKLRVIILGDENDSNVFWEAQIILSNYLAKNAIDHTVIKGEAVGSDRHVLTRSANLAASWCFNGRSLEQINELFLTRKPKG
ncbi:prolyl oligopeptidase family serine peptidase [Variovorax sp. PCZ-1]|uniref:alpha/beta hydrolase family protein n=1 Tax=Variovorax sp. PCZ-1 TaxID=2835533 RepID=UPI001BCA82AA|nr:prolyl oligopeptidase family serine peptidase [Variovorax sp. PCZ-1]MBS7807690.1 prolyl oligopeptidase family serine peptidase [Variovorax sp. PCZ-1]